MSKKSVSPDTIFKRKYGTLIDTMLPNSFLISRPQNNGGNFKLIDHVSSLILSNDSSGTLYKTALKRGIRLGERMKIGR